MKKKNIDTYYYDKIELKKTSNKNTNIVGNTIYQTENIVGNIYYANTINKAGLISFINNITLIKNEDTIIPEISFNTSIGTIITDNGKLVFNLAYGINQSASSEITSSPNENKLLITKPTFAGGIYSNYENITISIYVVNPEETRLLTIEYY